MPRLPAAAAFGASTGAGTVVDIPLLGGLHSVAASLQRRAMRAHRAHVWDGGRGVSSANYWKDSRWCATPAVHQHHPVLTIF
jgi:hypothetical protein